MKLSNLTQQQILEITAGNEGLRLNVGPFTLRLRSNNKNFIDTFRLLYLHFQVAPFDNFIDFHIDIFSPASHRRWFRPQVTFYIDNQTPFPPYPLSHALPVFEWGLNWCIARYAQQYLMLHAAVLEKNGKALILPGLPGSGKSTLSAALAQRGWRFLSDEFCLIRPEDSQIIPIPRPTPLKNEAIDVIRKFAPQAFIGPLFPNTKKGTIAHLRAPPASIERQNEMATTKLIIFPRYQSGSGSILEPLNKPYSILKLAANSFNYEILGEMGFRLVCDMVQKNDCYTFTYSNLDEVIQKLDFLTNES